MIRFENEMKAFSEEFSSNGNVEISPQMCHPWKTQQDIGRPGSPAAVPVQNTEHRVN